MEAFNAKRPLGKDIKIEIVKQNDTGDLDFRIKCQVASYLELAELTPLSQEFGMKAKENGKLNVYEYAEWIHSLIVQKQVAYGREAGNVALLLYATHWQFFPNEQVVDCLRSFCRTHDCRLAAVFTLLTDRADLTILDLIYPLNGTPLLDPQVYKPLWLINLPPGICSWKVEI